MPKSANIRTAVIIACFVAAGCASKSYTTTLCPAQHRLDTGQAKFRIGHVDAPPSLIFYMSGYTDDDYWAKNIPDIAKADSFPRQLGAFMAEKYPALFTDAPDALSVDISFTISGYHATSTPSSFLAAVSWGIFGIVLPLPIAMQYDCAARISLPEMRESRSAEFRNRLVSWVSFPSPLALMPVPAKSDRRACGIHPYQSKYYSGRLFTLECFGEAVMQALDRIDMERLNEAYRAKTYSTALHTADLQTVKENGRAD